MAAFSAAISLKNTIQQILHSPRIWLVPPSREIIKLVYDELQPLQEILERLDSTSKSRSRKKVNALDGQIKDAVRKFEDSLEHLLSDQILSQFDTPFTNHLELRSNIQGRTRSRRGVGGEAEGQESHLSRSSPRGRLRSRRKVNTRRSLYEQQREDNDEEEEEERQGGPECLLFSIDLQRLQDDASSFIHKLKNMKEEYIYELYNMPEDKDADESTSSTTGLCGTKSKMIGLSNQLQQVQFYLKQTRLDKSFYALLGMAGVGKTTIAMEIFQDPSISTHFDHRVWVKVGRKSQFDQLSQRILAQLDPSTHGIAEEIVGDLLKERLEGKKSLIVLDDVWEEHVLGPWIGSLPELRNGTIRILVTARDRMVTSGISLSECHFSFIVVRFLNQEESKELLCEEVFGAKTFPPQLEKAATKIAKKCEGLPLMIVTVAQHLSSSDPPEYWEAVAEMQNSVFMDAYDEIYKVLFPTYDYSLHQRYKMFFLYLGVFPPDYDIPTSKLLSMLTAEGWFLDINQNQLLETSVMDCWEELGAWKNLLLFERNSIFWHVKLGTDMYKTCRLHSSWRHLCMKEASKIKFYHVLNRLADASQQVMQGQRCLCLQNNILFAIKEFSSSVRSNCASSTRSLLFFGPYHQFPIPIAAIGFKLLTKLDALNLRFYAFPEEIVTLAQLKYLSLTCNGEIPTTISKLFKLRVLIINPHINIKCSRDPSSIPVQIWDMQDLEHIEISGKSLLAPRMPNQDVALQKLLSLVVGVNADTISTISELSNRRIPHIKKLGVQMELTPYGLNQSSDLVLKCFDCTSKVQSLEVLKCSIINPVLVNKYSSPSPRSLMLPHGLKKLHLSGMGFPWAYAVAIGSLPRLKVLKLRSYAFQGPKWETEDGSFSRLVFLVIEDSDLVEWKPKGGSFCGLTYLRMTHCYKLRELGWPSESRRRKIELVDCNPLAVTCAKQLRPKEFFTGASYLDKQPSTTNIRIR